MARTFPIMLNLRNRLGVVVGGGQVGMRKVEALLRAGAAVRLVAPALTATPPAGVQVSLQPYSRESLDGAFIVMACTDDQGLNRTIAADARKVGAMVNVADNPDACDFFLPAVAGDGDVVVAVGTGGAAPALAARLRDDIARSLPERIGEFAGAIELLRRELTESVKGNATRQRIAKRMVQEDFHRAFVAGGIAALREKMCQLLDGS